MGRHHPPTKDTHGSIALSSAFENVAVLGDGLLALSDDSDTRIIDSAGDEKARCDMGFARVAADGKTLFGVVWMGDRKHIVRGKLEGGSCTNELWGPELPVSDVNATTFVGELFVVVGGREAPGDLAIAYDGAGKEAFRFGPKTSEEPGFLSMGNHIMPCPGGICALEAKSDGFELFGADGAFIASVPIDVEVFRLFNGASRGGNFVDGIGYFGVYDKNTVVRIDNFASVAR